MTASPDTTTGRGSKRRLTGRHVLAWLVGFFAIVMAVNGVFVYVALKSWTGLDTGDAYSRGLQYNERIDEAAAQRLRAWRVSTDVVRAEDGRTTLVLDYADKDGAPIAGLSVTVKFRRPTQAAHDREVELSDVGGGRYRGEARLALAGQWDFHAIAMRGDAVVHRLEERLWLN